MKIILGLLLFFIINGFVFSQEESTHLSGLNNEIELTNIFVNSIKDRESKIYNYRIHFSDLITNIATKNISHSEFTKSKNELDELEKRAKRWTDETKLKHEKILDLIALLKQSNLNYSLSLKKIKGKERKKIRASLRDIISLEKRFQKFEDNIAKHELFLQTFYEDTSKWKKYLSNKIRKNLDKSLFGWELNSFFLEPTDSMRKFYDEGVKVIQDIRLYNYSVFFKENKKQFFSRFILALVAWILMYSVAIYIRKWKNKIENQIEDHTIIEISELLSWHPISFASLGLLFFVFLDFGTLKMVGPPAFIFYTMTVVIITSFWMSIGHKIIQLFADEANQGIETKKIIIRRTPIIIFIITRSLQSFFYLGNDLLILINSVLLGWISFKFISIFLGLKINIAKEKKDSSKKLTFFIQASKIFIIIFSGAILVSTIMEVSGFVNLARSLQFVVANNIMLLLFGWVFYHGTSLLLDNYIKKLYSKKGRYRDELVAFYVNTINVVFVLFLTLFVVESWIKTVFVFSDFWSLPLFKLGDYNFTIDRPVKLLVLYYLLRFAYLNILNLLETVVLTYLNISKKYASNVITIIRYTFILIYISIAAAILGFTYKNLIIFASALGVGIGFGLQNVANNFISGIILLFEQPIRVGDIIEIDSFLAKVKHIGIRSTIVETLENSSVIIPNSEILSNKLTNLTFNDNVVAIKCEVGVAYGSNTKVVSEILKKIAAENSEVLSFPDSQIWFTEFGESSLNFTLKVWINHPEKKFIINSSLMHEINKSFKDENITIPFPQRDLHLHTKDRIDAIKYP